MIPDKLLFYVFTINIWIQRKKSYKLADEVQSAS